MHVFPAERAIERGLPAVELRFRVLPGLTVVELPAGDGDAPLFRCEELGTGGRVIGALELHLFPVALVIDRIGVLAERARAWANRELTGSARWRLLVEGEVELAGGTAGHRIDVLMQSNSEGRFRPSAPYASWLALASRDAVVPAGVLAVVHSAAPVWRAGTVVLDSLEILGSSGAGSKPAGGSGGPRMVLPLVRTR